MSLYTSFFFRTCRTDSLPHIILKNLTFILERKFKLSSQTVGLLRAEFRFPEDDKSSEVLLLENLSNYYLHQVLDGI